MPPTCRFITYGCKVNQYDTQALREDLLDRGFSEARGNAPPDVVVVNTCTVTETAAREALRRVRRLAAHPGSRVVVTGCMALSHRAILEAIPGVSLLAPNEAKPRIGEAVSGFEFGVSGFGFPVAGSGCADRGPEAGKPPIVRWLSGDPAETFRPGIRRFEGRTRAYVKVQDGCNLVCSYCIIPRVRGRSRSRPAGDAVDEVRRLVDAGYREVVLTGVHLGSFGRDLPGRPRFAKLLARLLEVPGDWRLRLSSIEASELQDEDVAALAELCGPGSRVPGPTSDPGNGRIGEVGPWTSDFGRELRAGRPRLCPHVHLPLQSGSPSVLRRMRRPYTLERFESRVGALRARMPDVAVTTDLIVGFPGESGRDFEDTLEAARRMAFSRVHIFPYSARVGTEAARMPGALPPAAIKDRVRALGALARETAAAFHRRFVGRAVEVLVEDRPDRRTGRPCGYSEHYMRMLLEPGVPVNGLTRARVRAAGAEGGEGAAEDAFFSLDLRAGEKNASLMV